MNVFKISFLALAAAFTLCACDDDDDDNVTISGGGDAGVTQACKDAIESEPCGGDANGSWKMTDFCAPEGSASGVASEFEDFDCNIDDRTCNPICHLVRVVWVHFLVHMSPRLISFDCFFKEFRNSKAAPSGRPAENLNTGRSSSPSQSGLCCTRGSRPA